MRRINQSRPTPAFVIAVVALVAALGGGAVAGVAVNSLNKKEKKQVKNISKKQAKKQAKRQFRKVPVGPAGPAGVPGPEGPKGNQGEAGSDADSLRFVTAKNLFPVTTYLPVGGWIEEGSISATGARSVAAGPFSATDLRVEASSALGPDETRTFTFRKNASATALACTIGSLQTGCVNGESVEFAAGDTLEIESKASGTPVQYDIYIGWRAESP